MARMRSGATAASSSIREMARAMARTSPASTRSARAGRVTSVGKQLARDDEPLHFARSLSNGGQLDVAKELLRRIVLDEAVAAENLHSVLRCPHRDFTGVEFG